MVRNRPTSRAELVNTVNLTFNYRGDVTHI